MSPYVEQVAAALFAATDPLTDHHPFDIALARHIRKLAPRVDAALMRAYWQGWDDGIKERRKIQPSGAAGRGVLAALGELRRSGESEPPTPRKDKS